MNPPSSDHVQKVLEAHHQFPGDYCAVSALEFASKIYERIGLDQFPLQVDPQNQHKGFGEQALQSLVYLTGKAEHYDIQSAVETIEKETSGGKCVSVSLRGFLFFGQIVIPVGYHIVVALWLDGQPILVDPQTKQVLVRGKEDLTKVLTENSQLNPQYKTIYMEILTS